MDWGRYVQTAWTVHPRLALGLMERFSGVGSIENELFSLIIRNAVDPSLQALPQAGVILASCDPIRRMKAAQKLELLKHWAPASISDALGLMAADSNRPSTIKTFIIASLSRGEPEQVKQRP